VDVEDAGVVMLVLVPVSFVGVPMTMNQVGRTEDCSALQDLLGRA
jgi:hypothetical protein